MSNQRNPNTIRIGIVVSLEDAARLRTYLRGKTVKAESIAGRGIRKPNRRMTPTDFFSSLAHDVISSVTPVKEDLEWMARQLNVNKEKRKKRDQEVKSGKYRLIPGERSKPGRKAGVYYPAYEAAQRKKRNDQTKNNPTNRTKGKTKNG